MSDPVIAGNKPATVDLDAGEEYHWCACGRSSTQPFCDGSHKATGFSPVKFEITKTGTVALCGCKQTGNAPFCDSTHDTLGDTGATQSD